MSIVRFLVPDLPAAEFRRMLLMAIAGALSAGIFGVVHDQVTFTISPEYFTRMKFDQFRHADFGFPPRILVATIGFLATWWVGLIASWFLARRIVPSRPVGEAWHLMGKSLARMLGGTVACAFLGAFVGPWLLGDSGSWNESLGAMGVSDKAAFTCVAGIHTGAYLGAFVSWLVILLFGRIPAPCRARTAD